jgi:Ca-activated chloride channel family protein
MLAGHPMRTRSLLTLAAAAVLLVTAAADAQRLRVSTQTVPIYATVVDSTRRLVADLQKEDFEVYDNGKLQPLTNFDNQVTPFTAIVMLDTSGSMTVNIDVVKQAAEEFLIRLLPEDKAKVGAFNDKIQILPKDEAFTSDRDRLIRLVKDGLDFGYPTRLWDAVDESIAHLESQEGRRVVLVFTDGDDSASRTGLNDVLARARAKDMMVYAIGMQSDYFNGQSRVRTRPARGLRRIAEETGGGYFELTKKDDLGPTFTRVAQELHSQYVLGFSPAALDGKVHKLDIKVKRPGMTARGRKSYVATPQAATAGGPLLP